jgi:ubiquinone/menaquinone biosynthesis C-methylase UbiE
MNGEDTGQDHQHHHHYDHYSPAMAARLDGFYGRVDERLNARIAAWVTGKSVLDVGCGFGQLVDSLRKTRVRLRWSRSPAGLHRSGKAAIPAIDLRVAKSESLEFPDKSFDTVVLKDTIHHVYEEDDVAAFLADVRRVARKRLIILDPNPTAILLLARKIIGHVDPVCGPSDANAWSPRPASRSFTSAIRSSSPFR